MTPGESRVGTLSQVASGSDLAAATRSHDQHRDLTIKSVIRGIVDKVIPAACMHARVDRLPYRLGPSALSKTILFKVCGLWWIQYLKLPHIRPPM